MKADVNRSRTDLPFHGKNPIKCLNIGCQERASHGRSVCPVHWEQLLSVYFGRD